MRNIRNIMKKNWISIWLIVVVLMLSSVVVYATYTRITTAKRVISTDAGAGILFSSNLLNSSTLMTTNAAYYQTEGTSGAKVDLYVYNYATPKKSIYFKEEDTLNYTLTVKLVRSDGTDLTDADKTKINGSAEVAGLTYKVGDTTLNSGNDYSTTLANQSIASDKARNILYNLLFDELEISDNRANAPGYMMYIEAKPDTGYDLPTLKGYVGVRKNEVVDAGWYGELVESDSSASYDGYNYEIKGNGIGVLTISWDKTMLEPNDFIFSDSSNTFVVGGSEVAGGTAETVYVTTSGTTSSMKLKLDSSTGKVQQIIQFYKVQDNTEYALSAVKNAISYQWTTD